MIPSKVLVYFLNDIRRGREEREGVSQSDNGYLSLKKERRIRGGMGVEWGQGRIKVGVRGKVVLVSDM